MLPAEKTQYRKGLALGMTLAEIFSVLVFILLLACAVLLKAVGDQAEEELQETEVDLAIAREALHRGDTSWVNTDAWFEEARRLRQEAADAEERAQAAVRQAEEAVAESAAARALLDSAGVGAGEAEDRLLDQAVQLAALRDSVARIEARRRDQAERLAVLESDAERRVSAARILREQITQHEDLTADQADSVVAQAVRAERLQEDLADARRAVHAMDARLRAASALLEGSAADSLGAVADSFKNALAEANQERDEAVGRAEYREDELNRLRQGSGVDPPPCWMDAERRPEHIFRVELTNRGMRVFHVAPSRRADDAAMAHAGRIEDGREYVPEDFLRLTQAIFAEGRRRTASFGAAGCRFWVQPVDRTGNSKDIFQERQRQLWTRFWFRW